MKTNSTQRASKRGSILIVALLLAAAIGISLASYLQLGRSSITISNRALYNNGAMNIAESGLEEAMFCLNKMVSDTTYSWPNWDTSDGVNASRTFTGYTFDQNATGSVKVYVSNYKTNPKLYTRSTVSLGGVASRNIEKWVEVDLSKTSKFANGLVAKKKIKINGTNATANSWHSKKKDDGTPRSPYVNYDPAYKHALATVASNSVTNGDLNIGNADIMGYVTTGGGTPNVGPNGTIGDYTTTLGTIDATHVSGTFSATFETDKQPTGGTTIALISATSGTIPLNGSTTPGTTTTYSVDSITLSSSAQLSITGNVTLLVTSSAQAIKISGNAGINIASGATLIIYTPGDVDIGGNGVLNGGNTLSTANLPESFQLSATRVETGTSTPQDIKIAGNGVLSGVVYAPYGDVTINGGSDVSGSVVANNITMNGSNTAFHYDESLADLNDGTPYRIGKWSEITSATARAALPNYVKL